MAEDLSQYVRQVSGIAILNRVDKYPSPWTLSEDIDALQPSLDIDPSRFAMADHQKLIDPRNRKKLRGKAFCLRCRRGIGLHDPCHLLRQLLGARYLGLVDLHAHPGKDLNIDQISNLHETLDIGGEIHDDEKIATGIIQDLASRRDKWGEEFLHLPNGEKAHRHYLKGISVLSPLLHRTDQSLSFLNRGNVIEISTFNCHSIVDAQHLVKDGEEIFLPKRLGAENRDRSPNLWINDVGEL